MTPYYEEDGIALYQGCCLDVLPRVAVARPSVLVTDPPYTAAGGSTNGWSSDADTQFFSHWLRAVTAAIRGAMLPDSLGFCFADWRTINVVADAFRTPGDRQTGKAWECTQALVWDRESIGLGSPFRNAFEMIAVLRGPDGEWAHMPKNIPTVVRHRWPYGAHEHHGAEKPLGLVEQLVLWADPTGNAVILDPFTGSGTTLVAAKRLGRKAIGIELNPAYCDVIVQRLRQGSLLTGEVA